MPEMEPYQGATPPSDAARRELSKAWRDVSAFWMLIVPVSSFWVLTLDEAQPVYREHPALLFFLVNAQTIGWLAIPVALAILVTIAALLNPQLATRPLIRLGLQCALAYATSYAVAIAFGTVLYALVFPLAFFVVAWVGQSLLSRKSGASETAAALVIAMFAVVMIYALATNGEGVDWEGVNWPVSLFPLTVMLSGPFVCMWIIARLLSSTSAPNAPAASYIAAGIVLVATWQQAISRSLEMYNQLPDSLDCYVVTAAAHGHPQVVGSTPGRSGPVNRQLQTLKAGELVLASLLPRTHQAVRCVYNRIGPVLANKIRRRPLLADLAYLTLLPIHLVVRTLLRMTLPRSARPLVDRIYL